MVEQDSHPQLWLLVRSTIARAPVFRNYREFHNVFQDPMTCITQLRQWEGMDLSEKAPIIADIASLDLKIETEFLYRKLKSITQVDCLTCLMHCCTCFTLLLWM